MAFPVYPTTHFVLARQSLLFPEGVTLDVPLHIVRNITPRPVKWLRYASWAILHLEGTIYQNDRLLYDNDTIEDGVECLFMPDSDLTHAVPVNYAINARRTTSSSSDIAGESDFKTRLQHRDVGCVFTHSPLSHCHTSYIVPHGRNSDWINMLSKSRYPSGLTAENEDVRAEALEIDSPVNGLTIYMPCHRDFDAHRAIILKTPNHILDASDIAPPTDPVINDPCLGVDYPKHGSFTWHWLTQQDDLTAATLPNNTRAMFNLASSEPRPSGFLLDIAFAATILHLWGAGTAGNALKKHPGCPKTPPPAEKTSGHPKHRRENGKASGTADELDATDPSDPWDILVRASFLRPGVRELFEAEHSQFEDRMRTWRNAISDSEPDSDNCIPQELDTSPA